MAWGKAGPCPLPTLPLSGTWGSRVFWPNMPSQLGQVDSGGLLVSRSQTQSGPGRPGQQDPSAPGGTVCVGEGLHLTQLIAQP